MKPDCENKSLNDLIDEIERLKAEKEIDINTPFFGNSGAKIPKQENEKVVHDVNFHLVNAIRLLDNEQLKYLADSIYQRIPKQEVNPEPVTVKSVKNCYSPCIGPDCEGCNN